jgi:hypothetical protein
MVATEYALKVAFRKVVAGSEAAWRLYPRIITKPVYVLCSRAEKHQPTCAFVNEAEMSNGAFVKQTTIENFIYGRLAIAPSVLTTFSLTPTNVQSLVFDDKTTGGETAPTAKWIVVLFFRGGEIPGSTNRLRVLLALERFFYGNRIRIAEADLANAASVYSVVSSVRTVPDKPELWLFNPATHQGSKYDSTLGDLTHSGFEAWLARRGVTPPRDAAIDLQAAWRELERLETIKGN